MTKDMCLVKMMDQKITFLVIFWGWCCKEGNSSAKMLTREWGEQMFKLSRRMLCLILGPPVQEECWQDLDKLGWVQWGPARWWWGLKHLSFEVRQWEWGSFSLEKGRLPGDLIATCQYLQGSYHEDGARLFTVVRGRSQGMLSWNEIWIDARENCLIVRAVESGTDSQGGCAASILRGFYDQIR